VLGVYSRELTPIMARVLGNIGAKRAFVVHGLEGLDEISISGPTQISELRNGKIRTYKIFSSKLGIKKTPLSAIKGQGAKENARAVLSVLKGQKGPKRDALILNAGYALVAAGKARNIKQGMAQAAESIDSAAAITKLKQLKEFTNK